MWQEQMTPVATATAGNGHPSATQKQHQRRQRQPKQPQQQCLVCYRRASGYHYGAMTCEACKAFFKRTVHSCLTYFCPVQRSGSRCPVRVRNKRQCPACRWKRCLEARMQVRLVRSASPDPAGGQGLGSAPIIAPAPIAGREPPAYVRRLLAATSDAAAAATAAAATAERSETLSRLISTTGGDGQLHFDVDLTAGGLAGATSQPERHAILLGVCFDRLTADLVAFAKHLDGFAALPMQDRVQLMQLRWLSLIAWQVAFQSSPYDGHLKLCRNFWIREDAASLFAGRIPVRSGRLLRCLAALVTRLGVSPGEYLLLRAAFLLEATPAYSWADRPAIDSLQRRYLAELRAACPDCGRRARLLSLDGLLSAVRVLTVGYWSRVMQRTPYLPPPLVSEMLSFSLSDVPHVSSGLSGGDGAAAGGADGGVVEAVGSAEAAA